MTNFSGLISFSAYFAACLGFAVVFCAIYMRMTPHREFDLIVREHNASAAVAFGGTLLGFTIALDGAIHNTQTAIDFIIWALVAVVTQVIAYLLARSVYRDLSKAIEQNAIAAAIWVAAVSISIGILSAACMSP